MSANNLQAIDLATLIDHWRSGGAPPPDEFNFLERLREHGTDATTNKALYVCPEALGPFVLVDFGCCAPDLRHPVMVGVWSNETNLYCFSDGDCYAPDSLTRGYTPKPASVDDLVAVKPSAPRRADGCLMPSRSTHRGAP